jgi:16S rRNA (uracil1498-N3)-methyltransferase
MHHFFISLHQKHLGKTLSISKTQYSELYHQISKVLKLHAGEQVGLLNNSPEKFIYEINQINDDKKEIYLRLVKTETEKNSAPPVHLFIGIPKKDKLELIVEKCSELGIDEITPIITQRTIKNQTKTERLLKISGEAIEQSHGFMMPKVNEATDLKNINLDLNGLNLIFHTQENTEPDNLKNLLKDLDGNVGLNIFIGPEGGFSPDDLKILQKLNNPHFIKLGERILKTETAAIVITALAKYYSQIN